jgi:hypothetical protein
LSRLFGGWVRQVSLILRMPLKRVTPSFTVEYRQAKRPSTGSAKPGWANVRLAPIGLDERTNRTAISAFKTVAAKPPADVISPSVPSGRILPSLVKTALMAGQADAGSAQSRSHESAAKAGHSTQVAAGGTAAHRRGELAAEDLDPSIGVDTILRLKRPTTSDLRVEMAGTPRSEKRSRRPAEKQEKLDNVLKTPADRSETAPVSSTSGLPLVDKPSSTTRTSRILGRYVFRDELSPGESWKRRIEARRQRRA